MTQEGGMPSDIQLSVRALPVRQRRANYFQLAASHGAPSTTPHWAWRQTTPARYPHGEEPRFRRGMNLPAARRD
jgi:hypothetical protein